MATAKFTSWTSILAACTLSSSAEEVVAPTPIPAPTPIDLPTDWPTYWPTYSPTAVDDEGLLTSLRCPSSFESYVHIDDAASMQYSIVQSDDPLESGIFCGRLFVDSAAAGWAAIAFSEDGNMSGSDAIVADLEDQSVLKYHLGAKSSEAVTLMEDAKQTLQHTYVGVFGTMAVVEFTKLLVEDGEVTINEDMNIFLHARGDIWPGYHTSRTVFVDVVDNKRTIAPVCDESRPCPEGEYCKFEPGKCLDGSDTQEGMCVRVHDNCNWPVSYLPICGCDGETYGNECEVDEFGTSVAYLGQCEEATREVNLSPSDPDLSCPENQCLDLDGECGNISNCFADPCQVQNECTYAECEANYCGGCRHVCNVNGTELVEEVSCPDAWQPVCGVDGITYSNDCEASKVNATIANEGECKEPPIEAQTTSTQGTTPTTSQTTSSAATSAVTTSEIASTTLPENTSSTTVVQTTTTTEAPVTTTSAPPKTSEATSAAITSESASSTLPATTSSTTVVQTTTTTEAPVATTSASPKTSEATSVMPTPPDSIEGKPGLPTSAAEKSVVSLFSLSCLALAWNLM